MKYFKITILFSLFLFSWVFAGNVLAAPTVSTSSTTNINATYATANGSLDDLGGETIGQHGFVWSSTDSDPVIGTSSAPISQWKMNDNAANTDVADSAGSNTGTAQQNTSSLTDTGKINSALTFNGSGDYISVPNTVSSSIGDNITISAWVYSNSLGQSSDYRAVMSEAYAGDGNVEFELFLTGANHNLSAGFFNGSWHQVSETNAFPLNQWVHVAATYDGHYIRVYRDGNEVATSSDQNLSLPSGTNGWRIGRRHDSGGAADLWNGKIDDVRIYNATLSTSDINIIYNLGNGTEESLVGSSTYSQLGSKGSTGSFSSQMSNLSINTTYYVKAYVNGSSSGLVYGSADSFATSSSGYVTWDGSDSTAWSLDANWVGGTAPTPGDEVIIDGSYTNPPTLDLSGGAVTIDALSLGSTASSTLTISNGDMDTKKLTVTNDAGIGAYGTLTHTANTTTQAHVLNLEAANLTILAGGKIDVSSKGFEHDQGTGKGTFGDRGGGAGYGGSGGTSVTGYAGGVAYGSATEPTDLGSGGANNTGADQGGSGGGTAKLVVSGTLAVSGDITANGQNYIGAAAGGGSGGSIWLDAGILSGSGGTISANGGTAHTSYGGGGGGGRIAIYYTTDSSSLAYQVYGGTGWAFAGAGTIYKKADADTYGDLIIDNNDQYINSDLDFGKTPIGEAMVLDTITVRNYGYLDITSTTQITYNTLDWSNDGFIADNGGTFALVSGGGSPTIPSGATLLGNTPRTFTGLTVSGTLTHSANAATQQYVLDYTVNGNATIESGGKIDVDYKGFQTSEGPGQGVDADWSSSGASYGGLGGKGATGAVPGSTYGSVTEPDDLGSGGGYRCCSSHVHGGGAVKLFVSGTTTITGSISANGENSVNGLGGSSGGSVWLDTGTLSGTGIISANGGNGNNNTSGAGGGGRIAIYHEIKNASLTVTVNGGGAGGTYRYGQFGTIVYNSEYVSIIDPGDGAGTDHTSLSDWEGVNQADITAIGTKVFNHSGITGSISNGATVTGATSGNKAEAAHATASQILLKDIRKPLSGTLTFTNSSATVSGASTSFATQIAAGDLIWLDADGVWAQVSSIESNTALTLDSNYTGTGGAGAGSVRKYSFTQGEQVYQTQGVDYVVVSDTGLQPIAVAKLRNTNGSADTTAVTLDGWNTSETNYIKIWTDPSESYRHEDGRWNDNKYRLEVSGSSALVIREEYVQVEGIQLKLTADSANDTYGIEIRPDSTTNEITISRSIFKGAISGTSTGNSAIAVTTNDSETHIFNNLFLDFVNSSNSVSAAKFAVAGNHYLYNNTAQNCYDGYVQTAGTVFAKNNIAQDCTDGYFGTFSGTSTTNITDVSAEDGAFGASADSGNADGIGASANVLRDTGQNFQTTVKSGMIVKNTTDTTYSYVTAVNSDTELALYDDIMDDGEDYTVFTNIYGIVNFINKNGGDFRLLNSDTTAINKGTDLSGDADSPLTDDIESQVRSKTWDIGADEGSYPTRMQGGVHLRGDVRLR